MATAKKNVVVIGGGTGTFAVLSGLKAYADEIALTAIVAVSDSGGSNGRLRDELGTLPFADARMALIALADETKMDSQTLRELMLYRFTKGVGLQGHNFGNLFLTALSEVMHSEEEAIAAASRMLGVTGVVLPVSCEKLTLCAEYSDGLVVRGESHIDEPAPERDAHSIRRLWIEPESHETEAVRAALARADMIVLGPGDLYTSLLAACLVGDMPALIQQAHCPFVYIGNLFSKFGQTTGYDTARYVAEVSSYVGRTPDAFFINTTPFPKELVEKYATTKEFPVVDAGSGNETTECVRTDLLAEEEVKTRAGDVLKRSLIRHDREKLARALMAYLMRA